MRFESGGIFALLRVRAKFSRSICVLALAVAAVVLEPGFERFENLSDDEGIGRIGLGTSAHAKRRKKSGSGVGTESSFGSFSGGAASSTASWGGITTTGTSAGSTSAAASTTSNTRSDNNSATPTASTNGSSARPAGSRKDDDQNNSGEAGPSSLLEMFKIPLASSNEPAARPIPSTPGVVPGPSVGSGSNSKAAGTPGATVNTLPPKSALGVPPPLAKPVPKGTRAPSPGASAPVEIGSNNHAISEILGLRLNSKAVQALVGMGFAIPPQPKTGFDVLLLTTPPGMSADAAQTMLREAMPKEKFETNKFYRNYQTRSSVGNAHSVTAASQQLTCTGSRCAPRELIKWSPENLGNCTSGIAVGVLDTGLDVNHPAFARPLTNSFIPEGRIPAPSWHGTAVYALLAGNPRSGTPGLIPNATIYHGNVFYADATGEVATDTHVLLSALDWMDRAGVKVVNMSFAGPRDQVMEEAIAKLSAKGMVFVAAVGNEGPTAEPAYPAAYRQVIAVTAIKSDRRVYPYANRGRHIDLSAPGVDIWTAVPGAREGYYTGTSFAAPFATALVATLYRENPTPIKEKLLDRLDYDDLGLPGRDSTYGRGLGLAPRTCAPAPVVAAKPAPPPNWGTTSVDKVVGKASAKPSAPSTVSAGFR
jgi:minor extracellular protease Epr